jgi:hypothetical protein
MARPNMPPHARAAAIARGHRFAAYPRCSADLVERAVLTDGLASAGVRTLAGLCGSFFMLARRPDEVDARMAAQAVKWRACAVVALAASPLASGCHHHQRGDLTEFLSRELTKCGAHLTVRGSVTPIQAEWDFSPDANGFILSVRGGRFGEVSSWLQGALGDPALSVDGARVWGPLYKMGVAVQCLRDDDGTTRVICLCSDGHTRQRGY